MHHNVQSLFNKLPFIEILAEDKSYNLDVLCFSEHWLTKSEINNTQIQNFYLAGSYSRQIYTSKRPHGGTCIYVRQGIQSKYLEEYENLCVDSIFEMSSIVLENLNIIIICIYRAPKTDFTIFMFNMENLLIKLQKKII